MNILNKVIHNTLSTNAKDTVYVPIWYEFKSGKRIDLNKVIIEDPSGKYQKLLQIGRLKVVAWQKLNQVLPNSKQLDVPEIVFYER